MGKIIYDIEPTQLQDVGLGMWYYRTNITKNDEGMWECDEIAFKSPSELSNTDRDIVLSLMPSDIADKFRYELLNEELANTESAMLVEIENYLANKGVEVAVKRKEIRNKIDKLGKVIQTAKGNGTIGNPFKNWKVGLEVESGKWYLTENGYLWEAIKNGYPTSETDSEYFDIVGL